jgi:cyclopropane-fatty-acyl-phospholipid synthase
MVQKLVSVTLKGDVKMSVSTTTPVKDNVVEVTRAVLARLFGNLERRDFAMRLWNDEVIPAQDGYPPRFTLVLTHPGALRRMFLPPGELRLAEAYLRGDFDVEGDIIALAGLGDTLEQLSLPDMLRLGRQVWSLPATDPAQIYEDGRDAAQLHGRRHSRQRDRAAIAYHYNVGNDFYRLFLGQWMAYSCAYFPEPEMDLDAAQAAKFEHICRKLRLQPGERLLDIGCGWGGVAIYAAKNYGVQATGITLSQTQAEYGQEWIAREGLAGQVRLELLDYRDIDAHAPYDKVVSVGMFEHVGGDKLSEYFQAAFHALRPGGLFLNHGIARQHHHIPGRLERRLLQRGQFIQKYVFPDSELIPVSDALSVAEATGFEVHDVESLRPHYALTLRHWVHNLETRHDRAVQLKDERTYRVWRLYMAASVWGFESGQISVYQALLSKNRNGAAAVPLTRADLYEPA